MLEAKHCIFLCSPYAFHIMTSYKDISEEMGFLLRASIPDVQIQVQGKSREKFTGNFSFFIPYYLFLHSWVFMHLSMLISLTEIEIQYVFTNQNDFWLL